ncbi:hypothetical protein YPPY90_1034, partial [Yersinia pestis PY-90]
MKAADAALRLLTKC